MAHNLPILKTWLLIMLGKEKLMTEKQVWRIAVIPGDGIGQEVISEGLRILDYLASASDGAFAFAYESFPRDVNTTWRPAR